MEAISEFVNTYPVTFFVVFYGVIIGFLWWMIGCNRDYRPLRLHRLPPPPLKTSASVLTPCKTVGKAVDRRADRRMVYAVLLASVLAAFSALLVWRRLKNKR